MKQKLDLSSWVRTPHFQFFHQFEEPYWGVTVPIDCTAAYRFAKENHVSFFLCYLYQSLQAAQQTEAFRLRIENDEVYRYDTIDAGAAIPRSNGSFGFVWMPYAPTLQAFVATAEKAIAEVQATDTLVRFPWQNVIRYSALPWLNFTGLSHARSFGVADSAPRISFGKITETAGRKTMPVSIHVHHGLADGLHVGQFTERYQELMDTL